MQGTTQPVQFPDHQNVTLMPMVLRVSPVAQQIFLPLLLLWFVKRQIIDGSVVAAETPPFKTPEIL